MTKRNGTNFLHNVHHSTFAHKLLYCSKHCFQAKDYGIVQILKKGRKINKTLQ